MAKRRRKRQGRGRKPKEPVTMVVDGPNILMRSVMAMGRSGLSSDGKATGPLYSFIGSMSALVKAHQPARVVVCWDESPSWYRTSIYPGYKAHRSTEPSEVAASAFAMSREFLTLAGVPHTRVSGYEADDLIAGYVRRSSGRVIVVSGDKDLLQLVGEGVWVDRPGFDGLWATRRVQRDFGCLPAHVPLVLALSGDASDGVPGVGRVGKTTAIKDLTAVGWSLPRLLEEGHERYREAEALIRRNLLLVSLHEGVTRDLDLGEPLLFRPTGPTDMLWGDLVRFLTDLNMVTILSHLQAGVLWGSEA